MENITIRTAAPDDAEEILNIYAYYVEHTAITFEYEVPELEAFRGRIVNTLKKYPYLLILLNDKIMGYAYAGPFVGRAAYDWSVEMTVYIAHDARKCGLGRRIYEALEQELAKMGILNLYACIGYPKEEDEYLTKNSAEFHAHLGFKKVGEFYKCGYKFGRWYHMIWMEKLIGAHVDKPREALFICDAGAQCLGLDQGARTIPAPALIGRKRGFRSVDMMELLKAEAFDEVFEIMEKSFPKDEYRTYEGQKKLLEEPVYRVYVWRDSEREPIKGFIAIWEFEALVFIEHLAVDPTVRNAGIGSKILRELQRKPGKRMCLEVELPDTELASRRIGFYERNGFFFNHYPYLQPALAEGQNEVPLLIMTTGKALEEAEFSEIKELLYRNVYQVPG